MMPAMARPSGWWLVVLVTIGLAGCGGGDKVASAPAAPVARLTVSSPAFAPGGRIPARFTCSGAGDRPALRFGGVPSNAKELALIVIDPDAGGFVHWTVYGLAPGVRGIASTGLPAGARQGRNSTGGAGWTPPCPPSGTHHYHFTVYALSAPTGATSVSDAFDAIERTTVATGTLTGLVTH